MTLTRRLSSNPRTNQNYKAFREVGRVMRTVVLLRFLAGSGRRALVTAAANKAQRDPQWGLPLNPGSTKEA